MALNFDYYRPATLQDAVGLFQTLAARGREPVYYSGGTEIITLGRLNLFRTQAVIDIKRVPECSRFDSAPGWLVIGSAIPLTTIADSDRFPLLGKACGQIADRTARNKITLGGNICSALIYREAVLPLLLADAAVLVAGPTGVRRAPMHQIFEQQIRLRPGEMMVQVQIPAQSAGLPYVHIKRRRKGSVGYPVVTLAALKQDGQIRVALSGVCDFPFRSRPMEAVLNDRSLPPAVRAERAVQLLPAPLRDDVEASAEYRRFVLRNALLDAVAALEGGRV